MPSLPIDLGKISITYVYVDTRDDLIDVLHELEETLPQTDEPLGRIVLIIPHTLRQRLGWPRDRAPRPTCYQSDLVFSRPDRAVS